MTEDESLPTTDDKMKHTGQLQQVEQVMLGRILNLELELHE